MIDIENYVFTKVKDSIGTDAGMSSTYERSPKSFPHIQLEMTDCSVYERGIDSGRLENFANTKFEINIYSNKANGKKVECKALAHKVDDVMSGLGFIRKFFYTTPNVADMTIYRMTMRYEGVVGRDNYIYGR